MKIKVCVYEDGFGVLTDPIWQSIHKKIHQKQIEVSFAPQIGMSLDILSFKDDFYLTEEEVFAFENTLNSDIPEIKEIYLNKNYIEIWIRE